MNIHIVDSVKGGSGKSTFALKLAAALKLEDEKHKHTTEKSRTIKPIIVDLDIMGTSWFSTFGNSISENKNSAYIIYLNDLVLDWNYYRTMNFINEIKIRNSLSKEVEISVVVCSNEQSAKEKFKIDDQSKSQSIEYDVFCGRIIKLMEYLKDKEYTDIILDMPPNSEPYSNSILKHCLKNTKDNINLYMIASTDISHIEANINWYDNFISSFNSQRSITLLEKPYLTESECQECKNNDTFNISQTSWYKESTHKLHLVINDMFDYFNGKEPKDAINTIVKLIFNKSVRNSLLYHFVYYDDELNNTKKALLQARGSLVVLKCSELSIYNNMFSIETI